MSDGKPIFYDKERRRWRRTRMAFEITGALFTVLLFVFLLNIIRNPALPELLRPDTKGGLRAIPSVRTKTPPRRGRKAKMAALGRVPQNYEPLRAAFYVSDDYT